jgi:hypothetical protein
MQRKHLLNLIEDELCVDVAQLPVRNDVVSPRLASRDEAPEWLNTPRHIHAGYRVSYSAARCVASAFEWHNDTLNIWSHVGAWRRVACARRAAAHVRAYACAELRCATWRC